MSPKRVLLRFASRSCTASNLAEFQAIQMWRIEWLLAATASFVAGILLKKPGGN